MANKRKSYNWELPPEIEARLGDHSYGSQRAIFEADHLFLVLHAPPDGGSAHREARLFLRLPSGEILANGQPGGDLKLRRLIADYREAWESLDKEYDAASSASDLFKLIEKLAPLNRASTNLASALQTARDLLKNDRLLLNARDESYEVSRAIELLTHDAKLALDYRIARNAEAHAAKSAQIARAQDKLNSLAAMTLPLMAVATAFGMNLRNDLEEKTPFLFVLVILIGLAAGFIVRRWVSR